MVSLTSLWLPVLLSAVVVFFLVRYHELPVMALLVADAFALALFTMIGTRKGLAFPVAPAIAVMLGVTTGVAGGILRDLLIGEIPLVFRQGIYLYATAAFGGAAGFALLQQFHPDGAKRNAILGTAITLLLRLAGIRWRIQLPLFLPRRLSTAKPAGCNRKG